jgi:hypothetical protein
MTAVKENFAELREDGARLKDAWGVRVLGALVIVGATALAYVPAVAGKFVWDDSSWTTGIRPLLRDGSGLRRMWFDPAALQQYYPLSGTIAACCVCAAFLGVAEKTQCARGVVGGGDFCCSSVDG